jgi:hypothetical protein
VKDDAAVGVALWPLVLLAGLLPALASLLAFALASHGGLVPSCNPFVDGCVSISRAARHDLPNHVFRALVLPAAVLQALAWWASALALHALGGTALRLRARTIVGLGLAAGIALVLYGSFLGTEGATYRWLRRYGTVLYFGATCGAMLLTAGALQALQRMQRIALPRTHERVLLAVLSAVVLLGLGNVFVGLGGEPALKDRIENATEWWGALGLTLGFVTLASLCRRLGLRLQLVVGASRGPG